MVLAYLRSQLRHVKVVANSPAETTLGLLRTMLSGLDVTSISSILILKEMFSDLPPPSLDFIIIDHQSDSQVDEIVRKLEELPEQSDCKIIHLYTPTSSSLSSVPLWATTSPRVIRSHKPPRTLRLLQLLASLKGISTDLPSTKSSDVSQALRNLSAAKRTLYGNVLIAEGCDISSTNHTFDSTPYLDNPVAQQLLVKQLQRHQLNVIPTSNGEEAVAEWEAHDPRYFSMSHLESRRKYCNNLSGIALFDHRKSITLQFDRQVPFLKIRYACLRRCRGLQANPKP
jgi:CheY-like chemotaxis protein